MSILEHESKYPKTTGYIYSEAAKRAKKRKQLLKLTDTDIAGDFDRKVVNRILNNTKTRNNVYLIPPAYVNQLVNKLEFNSDYELFWGDEADEGFIETIFCNLLMDILDEFWNENCCDKQLETVSIIKRVLLDDVTYAKTYSGVMSYYEYENPEGEYLPILPLDFVNGNEQMSIPERKRIQQNAILRLYRNTRPIEMFGRFFHETNTNGENKGFSKLDKRLDIFVDKSLLPFLKENTPGTNSLGLRVHSIIEADVKNYVELGLINSERTAEGFDSYTSPEYDDILQSLMTAGRDYINQIEKLQVQLDTLHRKEKFRR